MTRKLSDFEAVFGVAENGNMKSLRVTVPKAVKSVVNYYDMGGNEHGVILRGLGLQVILKHVLEKAGLSTIAVAPKGSGKKILYVNTESAGWMKGLDLRLASGSGEGGVVYEDMVKRVKVVFTATLTRTNVATMIGDFQNGTLIFVIEDVGTILEKDAQTGFLFEILSQAITNPEIGIQDRPRPTLVTNTAGTKHICHIGAQIGSFNRLVKRAQWGFIGKDRYIRFFMLNCIRGQKTVDTTGMKFKIPNDMEIEMDAVELAMPEAWFTTCTLAKILAGQITHERATLYTVKLLKAYAAFTGRKKVTKATHNEFVEIFGFYMQMVSDFVTESISPVTEDIMDMTDTMPLYVLAQIARYGLEWVSGSELAKSFKIKNVTNPQKQKRVESSRRQVFGGAKALIEKFQWVEHEDDLQASQYTCMSRTCGKTYDYRSAETVLDTFKPPKKCICGARLKWRKKNLTFLRIREDSHIARHFRRYQQIIDELSE